MRSYLGIQLFAYLCLAAQLGAQAPLPVPENLKPQGIPAIPAAGMDRAARYNESRSALLQDWHPTRREILITTRFADVPQVHRVAMPGGARTQLTFYPERIGRAHYRPGAGDSFVFSKDIGGAEFYQLFRYDVASGDVTLLTDGKSRNIDPVWSRDGKLLAFASTRRNGRDTDLYVVDPANPSTTRRVLEVNGGGWSPLDWSPDGRTVLMMEYRSINESYLHLVQVADGRREPLTPAREKAAWGDARFSPDGKSIYLTTDRGSEFQRLAVMDLASRQLTFLRPEVKWDVTGLQISRDGHWLAYVVNEDGSETLHVLDTRTRQEASLPRLPLGTLGGVRWHNNNRDLGFSLTSARSPSDVYSIDVEKGTLERWTTSETGGLDTANFSEPELVRWKSFDGRTISGFLYRPPARFTSPRPVVINIHGGPEGQYQPMFLGRTNYYINELGIAMIFPNVRGSSGYGKTYLTLDDGLKREDSVKDIGALLDWIATRPELDARRTAVVGGSYGGYMVLATMTHYNDRIRSAVDVVGVSNFVSFLEHTEPYRRDLRRAEYGDERDPKMRDFLTTISPLTNIRKITKPMLVVAGKNDPRVPVNESEQVVAGLKQNGALVWYLLAEDEGHGFSKKRNQDYQFATTVRFFEEYLLGK